MPDVLQLSGVRAGYGETTILEDVSFSLPERGSLALLGRNGVGKTTLLATIMGHTTFHRTGWSSLRSASRRTSPLPRVPADGTSSASTTSSRASRSASTTAATRSPAASSRCSPSAAP
jgi:branched-chain amino acid transport system ATP-binding protein